MCAQYPIVYRIEIYILLMCMSIDNRLLFTEKLVENMIEYEGPHLLRNQARNSILCYEIHEQLDHMALSRPDYWSMRYIQRWCD